MSKALEILKSYYINTKFGVDEINFVINDENQINEAIAELEAMEARLKELEETVKIYSNGTNEVLKG